MKRVIGRLLGIVAELAFFFSTGYLSFYPNSPYAAYLANYKLLYLIFLWVAVAIILFVILILGITYFGLDEFKTAHVSKEKIIEGCKKLSHSFWYEKVYSTFKWVVLAGLGIFCGAIHVIVVYALLFLGIKSLSSVARGIIKKYTPSDCTCGCNKTVGGE